MTATSLKARALEVSAVSGDTVLNQCQTDRAQVNTVNGDITYNGRLSKAGRYELKTHSGDIMRQSPGQRLRGRGEHLQRRHQVRSAAAGDGQGEHQPLRSGPLGPRRDGRRRRLPRADHLQRRHHRRQVTERARSAPAIRASVPATHALHAATAVGRFDRRSRVDPGASAEPPERRLASEPNCLR